MVEEAVYFLEEDSPGEGFGFMVWVYGLFELRTFEPRKLNSGREP